MSTLATQDVLHHLQAGLESVGNRAVAFGKLPSPLLVQPPPNGGWSVVQILEHLNFYSRYYNTRFEAAIRSARQNERLPNARYQSGWLGDYFVKLMAPKADGSVATKMNAPAASVPPAQTDAAAVLAAFQQLQQALLQRVEEAATIRFDGIRVRTMLPLVSLRLGDAFRFLLAHQERHLAQADRTLSAMRMA